MGLDHVLDMKDNTLWILIIFFLLNYTREVTTTETTITTSTTSISTNTTTTITSTTTTTPTESTHTTSTTTSITTITTNTTNTISLSTTPIFTTITQPTNTPSTTTTSCISLTATSASENTQPNFTTPDTLSLSSATDSYVESTTITPANTTPEAADSYSSTPMGHTTVPQCQETAPPKPMPADSCGIARTRAKRIIGGTSTECRSKYPWVVLLLHNSNPLCGGTLWDSQHVLTAASCFQRIMYDRHTGLANVSELEVIAGKWEFALNNPHNAFEQRIQVVNATVHTEYETITYKADIALLKLSSPINITDTSLPICHPESNITLPRTATVAGWGTTFEGRNMYPEVLQEVDVNVYDWNDCYTLFAPWFDDGDIARYLHNGSVICGANGLRGGKDSCQGDSGGPMFGIIDGMYTLIGIFSYGYGCGRPGDPGFYTYVPFYLQWIQDTSRFMVN